ncbi:MAG: autotransporter-associated beta strand repeat-containing protein [Chthoniobacterales bacterium]
MHSRSRTLLVVVSFCLLGLGIVPARATAFTWTGLGSSDGTWIDPDNWSGGSGYPGPLPFSNDTVLFPALSQRYSLRVPITGGGIFASSITFAGPVFEGHVYSMWVQGDIYVAGGIAATSATAPDLDVDGFLAFTGSATVRNLTGSGNVRSYYPGPATLTVLGNSSNFAGTLGDWDPSAPLSLMVGAGSTLTLGGSNTYTGATTINGGTLVVDGSLGSAVAINDGGTLAPGNGQLTLLSGLTMTSGSTLEMEFGGLGLFDQLDVQGVFAAGGTLDLNLIGGYTPTPGDSFAIFNGATPGYDSGSFAITTNLGGGLSWDTSALASTGVVSVVPEPSTCAIVVVALLGGIVLLRWRRA